MLLSPDCVKNLRTSAEDAQNQLLLGRFRKIMQKTIHKHFCLITHLPVICGLFLFAAIITACWIPNENDPFFGKTTPPSKDVLRYISGPEPESLDPQVGTGQVEQRIYLALFEGLVEYHPQTLEPIPAIAERWETNVDSTEFIFNWLFSSLNFTKFFR